MSQTNTASQEYLKNAVMTAKPEQLQVMLLDGAIRFALKGREAIEAQDWEASFNNLDRAQRICLQLASGLNADANRDVAEQMISLYNFCYMRLVDAGFRRELKAIDDAVRVLKHQRDTWQLLVDRIAKETQGAVRPQAPKAVPTVLAAQKPVSVPNADDEDRPSINFEG